VATNNDSCRGLRLPIAIALPSRRPPTAIDYQTCQAE
jgi:hypothetical protein